MKIRKEAKRELTKGRIVSPNVFNTPDGKTHRKTAQSFSGGGGTFTGASPLVGAGGAAGSIRGQTITSAPIYYDPRYATPDKFYFPRTEVQANAIWRHLYETDAAISVATDMFAELPWSTFDLIGVSDKKVLETFESMMGALNLEAHMEGLTREFIKLGKVIPHLIFDNHKGYFIRLGAFDPDYVKVTPVPFMGEEPILDLKPDPAMRAFMKSQDARAVQIKAKLPAFLRDRVMTNMPIPLQNTNTTYIARKTSPYRAIGVSIYTRLFRIQMFEDFLVNASIAIAQRNAAPFRLFVLGDRETGWTPTDDDVAQFAEMLAIIETDPYSALIYHTGLDRVEYVGVSDKLMSISREWDFIERVKFLALGVSRAFLVGETSFAAALAGLQTLLDKLQALRLKFESAWIYPKIFEPVARMNGFYRRKKAELDHRYRVAKDDKDLIFPTIKWHKSLDAAQDTTLLSMWDAMQQRGVLSKRTLLAGAGLSLDIERANLEEERQHDRELGVKEKTPQEREEAFAQVFAKNKVSENRYHVPSDVLNSKIWNKKGEYRGVHFSEVEPIVSLLKFGRSEDSGWQELYDTSMNNGGGLTWENIDNELGSRGFTNSQADIVKEILSAEGTIPHGELEGEFVERLAEVEKAFPNNNKSLLSGI